MDILSSKYGGIRELYRERIAELLENLADAAPTKRAHVLINGKRGYENTAILIETARLTAACLRNKAVVVVHDETVEQLDPKCHPLGE